MRISLNLIKEYIDLPPEISIEKLCHDLTMSTVEVEGFVDLKHKYENIVVGKILKVGPHENADKLKVCMVDIGEENPVQIVCGGTNLYENEMVVISKPGSYVIWHGEGEPVKIKETKMRGVSSYGMICGADEVGLTDLYPLENPNHIVDLGNIECYPGQDISAALGLDDYILEIDNKSLTNRPDLYCHYGIARELSAIYAVALKPLVLEDLPLASHAPNNIKIEIENPSDCKRYMALGISGVSNHSSPLWLKSALSRLGIRPLGAIVDITNYVMIITGQPNHAFDKTKIGGGILVRNACLGEKLELIDERELSLCADNLVIADSDGVIGLAGIMGGKSDSVSEQTSEIILEIANFAHNRVRKSVMEFDIRTEASTRFEKNIDTPRVIQALELLQKLFMQIFPDSEITGFSELYPQKTDEQVLTVSTEFLSKRSGKSVDELGLKNAIFRLGFEFLEHDVDGEVKIRVPSWRSTGDISLPDDILEEYARMVGYNNFDLIAPLVALGPAINQRDYELESKLRHYLAYRAGMNEIYTYPWVHDSYIESVGAAESYLKLASPPTPETAKLRRSLIPGMLQAVEKNSKNYDEFGLFELTQVFIPNENGNETPQHLCVAIAGEDAEDLFYRLKAVIENMHVNLPVGKICFGSVPEGECLWADKNARAGIYVDGAEGKKVIGNLGLLSIKTASDIGIKGVNVAVCDLNFEEIVKLNSVAVEYKQIPQYPLVEHDISVVVDEQVAWESIANAIKKQVRELNFVDEYRGSQIPDGKKSVTLKVKFGSDQGTMNAGEISNKASQLLRKLEGSVGASVRDK